MYDVNIIIIVLLYLLVIGNTIHVYTRKMYQGSLEYI